MSSIARFEHRSAILHVEEKTFTLSRKEILQGLTSESAELLSSLGEEGWELVSVVRYGSFGDTEALLAFFKRPKG